MATEGRRSAGRLEHEVLAALWAAGAAQTASQVQQVLPVSRAYTTVTTILGRLHEKGLLARERDGAAYTYLPLVREDAVAARQFGQLLEAGADRRAVLRGFVTAISASDADLLRELLSLPGADHRQPE